MKSHLVLSVVAASLLAGCIPIKPPPGEKPFRSEQMSFVVIGETTRDEVLDKFASLDVPLYPSRFDDDAVWVYRADRDTWQWLVCVGAGYSADCGIVGMMRNYFLKFDFDSEGRVVDWSASSTLGECSTDGICEEGRALMVFADEDADRNARRKPTAELCAIYVFTSRSYDTVIPVSLDDAYVGSLLNDDAYVHLTAAQGEHRITTSHCAGAFSSCGEYGVNSQTLSVDCRGGEQVFLHHNSKHKDRGDRDFVLEQTSGSIADRKLALNPVPGESRPAIDPVAHYDTTLHDVIARRDMTDLVWKVQLRLKDLDLYAGRIDGEFNSETRSALNDFREANGLRGGGLLDDNTLTALGVYDD